MEKRLKNGSVCVCGSEAIGQMLRGQEGCAEMGKLLSTDRMRFAKTYPLSGCIVGAIMIDMQMMSGHRAIVIPYHLHPQRLSFVADGENAQKLERLIDKVEYEEEDTPEIFFCKFLEEMLTHDMEQLQDMETACLKIEEALMDNGGEMQPNREVLQFRKQLLVRNFYYQQMADLCDQLSGNEHDFFCEKGLSFLEDVEKRADRLYEYSQMLRDYLVQLRELYQQQVDASQNRTMQVLTVVTTIFLPLTLIAGWYGMNFEYMPELKSPYGYWIILGAAICIVIGEITYFRKKKYL